MSVEEQDKFDPLDEVLAAARWPEVSGEASARLRRGYEVLAGRGRVAWWGRGVAAVAAVVLVGVGVWVGVTREGVGRKAEVVVRGPAVVAEEKVIVRRANAAEMAVALTAARRQGQGRVTGKQEAVHVAKAERVDVGAELRAIAGKRGEGEALRVLKGAAGDERVVEELFARLDDPRVEIRLAAARALGYLDGPVVTARLAGMVEGNRNRREALAALMQSRGREAQEYLRRAEREGDVEAAMRSVAVQVRSF